MNAILLFTCPHSQLMRPSAPFTSLPPRLFSVYALHYDNQCLVKGKKKKLLSLVVQREPGVVDLLVRQSGYIRRL